MTPRTEQLTNVRSWKGAVMHRVGMVHRVKRHAEWMVVVTSQIESDLMAIGVRARSAGDGRLRQLNRVAMHRVVTAHPVKRHAVKRRAATMAVAMSRIVIDLIANGVRVMNAAGGPLRQLNDVTMNRVVTVHPVKRHAVKTDAVKRHAVTMAVAMSRIVIDLIANVDRTSRDDPMDRRRVHRETVLTAPDRNAPRKGE